MYLVESFLHKRQFLSFCEMPCLFLFNFFPWFLANWQKFLLVLYAGCFMLGNTLGAGCSWNQHPFGSALNRRLFGENPCSLGVTLHKKAIQSNLSCSWKEAPMWRHWTRANQLTMEDGWCLDRKHFFIEFLSSTNHPRTPTYLIVTYSLTYLFRYVVIIYIPYLFTNDIYPLP